jgi:hypothetical protein
VRHPYRQNLLKKELTRGQSPIFPGGGFGLRTRPRILSKWIENINCTGDDSKQSQGGKMIAKYPIICAVQPVPVREQSGEDWRLWRSLIVGSTLQKTILDLIQSHIKFPWDALHPSRLSTLWLSPGECCFLIQVHSWSIDGTSRIVNHIEQIVYHIFAAGAQSAISKLLKIWASSDNRIFGNWTE